MQAPPSHSELLDSLITHSLVVPLVRFNLSIDLQLSLFVTFNEMSSYVG